MSKVAIKGNASGTGTFTLEAPNSNTDRTLTLPDEAGTVLTSGTPLSSFPTGFANGITEADEWRITAGSSVGTAEIITANWERNDNFFGYIGSGMTQSSGVFTFPSTGIWLVMGQAAIYANSSAADYIGFAVEVSNNSGSSYSQINDGYSDAKDSFAYSHVNLITIIDVTDASAFRVRMKSVVEVSASFDGNTNYQRTGFTFIRLGDT